MKNKYRIEKVDHLAYTEEDWKHYFEFRKKSYTLIDQPMAYDSVEQLRDLSRKAINKSGQEIYQVWRNEQENGVLYFHVKNKDDLGKRFTHLNNFMIDKYLAPDLLEKIFKRFIDYDVTSNALVIQSKNGRNDHVNDLYNARIISTEELFELNVKEANMEKIDAWLAEAPSKFPNLRIAFYIDVPDDLLEEFAAVFTRLLIDIPSNREFEYPIITAKGVKAQQEAGKGRSHCAYRYMIFNEANQLIAKTNVSIHLKHPQEMRQFMTGVLEQYRGQGLSKWLKAAMFKKLIADFPELEKINSEVHPENHPSRELSKQMGYQKIGVAKEFLIDRSDILQTIKTSR